MRRHARRLLFFAVWLCAVAVAPRPARAQAPAREAGKAAPDSQRERARTLLASHQPEPLPCEQQIREIVSERAGRKP